MATMTVINKQSVQEFKSANGNSRLDILPSEKNPGKFFFHCAGNFGYVSAKAVELAKEGKADELMIGDVITESGEAITCLMPKGSVDTSKAVATL